MLWVLRCPIWATGSVCGCLRSRLSPCLAGCGSVQMSDKIDYRTAPRRRHSTSRPIFRSCKDDRYQCRAPRRGSGKGQQAPHTPAPATLCPRFGRATETRRHARWSRSISARAGYWTRCASCSRRSGSASTVTIQTSESSRPRGPKITHAFRSTSCVESLARHSIRFIDQRTDKYRGADGAQAANTSGGS